MPWKTPDAFLLPRTVNAYSIQRSRLAMMEDFIQKHPQLWNEDIGV
jgi:hypothetical protein